MFGDILKINGNYNDGTKAGEDKMDAQVYVDMWKIFDRRIWQTPIAFFTILTVLGTLIKYIVDPSTGIDDGLKYLIITSTFGLFSIALFCCGAVLYSFASCREKISIYILHNFEEEDNRCFILWGGGYYPRGYDYLCGFLNTVATFLLLIALHSTGGVDSIENCPPNPMLVIILSLVLGIAITWGEFSFIKRSAATFKSQLPPWE